MQTRRLGWFLGLGFAGVVLLLGGLSWDAVLHAHDPELAGREGLFAYRNPGHVMLGVGMAAVVVSLVGAVSTVLAASGNPRWARPLVQRAFLAGSAALVVAAASITSWSATNMHDSGDDHHELASSSTGTEDHHQDARTATAPHGHDAPGLDHHAPAVGTPVAAGHDDGHAHDASPAASLLAAPGSAGARPPAAHDHDQGPGAPAAAAEGHVHDPSQDHHGPSPSASAAPVAPAGADGHDHHQEQGAAPAPNHTHDPGAPATAAGELVELRYGPFILGPASAAGQIDNGNVVMPDVTMPCEDCYITYAEPDLVFADGSSANWDQGVMLHHAVFFNTGKKDATCGTDQFFGNLGDRFLASGNERTIKRLPEGYGYHLGSDPVNAAFHIMNHGELPQTVYFKWKIRWMPASTPDMKPVVPVWLDVENCRTSEYDVPAGPSSTHWQWKSNLTGRIVATGGHVHDGGIRTTLRNETTDQHICTSWASYGTKPAFMGTIESMSRCTWDALGTVRAGEVLDIEAYYDSPTPVSGAMGIMVAYVYETDDLAGGPPPPADVTGDVPAPPTSTPPRESDHHHGH